MRVSKNFLNTYANRGMDLENDINIKQTNKPVIKSSHL